MSAGNSGEASAAAVKRVAKLCNEKNGSCGHLIKAAGFERKQRSEDELDRCSTPIGDVVTLTVVLALESTALDATECSV